MDLLIYVMHPNKTLYCGDKKKCRFHHSSFLAGGTTVAAGSLLVDHGKQVRLTPHSGHCAPRSRLPLAARCAQGGGACLVACPLQRMAGLVDRPSSDDFDCCCSELTAKGIDMCALTAAFVAAAAACLCKLR